MGSILALTLVILADFSDDENRSGIADPSSRSDFKVLS